MQLTIELGPGDIDAARKHLEGRAILIDGHHERIMWCDRTAAAIVAAVKTKRRRG